VNETPISLVERPTQELVNLLLTNRDEDEADSVYWSAMSALHCRGTVDVFEAARSLCLSRCPLEQRIGCGILAQLGCPERPFASASFPLVVSVIRRTDDKDTLANGLCALGWLADPRGVEVVLRYIGHADSDIRYWVTHALTAMNEDERSIEGLILLTNDSDSDVRDWSTFGLGSQTEQDTSAIREALVARLNDADLIVRGEALVGLAKRQDKRVIEPLLQALESDAYKDTASDYAAEALSEIKDIESHPHLGKWKADA
jgi:HEAT repeat protein